MKVKFFDMSVGTIAQRVFEKDGERHIYVLGEYSFHSPIQKEDIKKYKLDVIEIEDLNTKGKDINDLISNQFVQKVLNLIDSGEYILKLDIQEGAKNDRTNSN